MASQWPLKVKVAGTSLDEFEVGDFVPIEAGGTGAITASGARTTLDVPSNADLNNHVTDTGNPHSVTPAQIGAATTTDLNNHVTDTGNPHSVTAAQAGAVPTTEKGAANGVATLDAGAKIPVAQIPAVSLPEVYVVADAAARLALTVQEGDEAIQLDDGSHWIYDGTTWYERPQPQVGITGENEGVSLSGSLFTGIDVTGEGVTASDQGAGIMEINVPLQFPLREEGESLADQIMTGDTFVQALRLTTTSVPAAKYKITWSFEVEGEGGKNNPHPEVRVQLDDTTTLTTVDFDAKNAEDTGIPFSSWSYQTLTAAVHNIDIDFRDAINDGTDVTIRNCKIEVLRVTES